MTEQPKRYAAGVIHYPGDVPNIVGEIKGPLTYGDHHCVVAVAAEYDPAADRTRVAFVHCHPEDFARAVWDVAGQTWRIPTVERVA